ncbi:MAG: response regulator transcription factor [Anaerolineae bacterium]|nr:response regulator transcription factor [Anaerolineae bacterium]
MAIATIAIIEDEQSLVEALEYNLRRAGYRTIAARDGYAGLEMVRRERPDLLILDLMLPGIDGLEICRQLRKDMHLPILILTARDEEVDKILGLELGADDYLTKPFSMRELIARVHALLRRAGLSLPASAAGGVGPAQILQSGDLTIDLTRQEVRRGDTPLPLKPKEYDLLLYFFRHKGQALSREQILEQVWGWDYAGGSRTVDVHVRWLRRKIEPDPSHPTRIVTLRGTGYRFEG